MQKINRPSKSLAASIALNILLMGATGFISYTYFSEHQQLVEARIKAQTSSTKIESMANTIGDLTSKITELEKRPPAPTADEIGAFAKQAATCDAIKLKLKIKD